MGRYSNVQAYSDDSPTMRSISYAQATGTSSSSAPTPGDTKNDGVKHPASSAREDNQGEGSSNNESGMGTKSNDDEEYTQQPQERNISCDTSSLFVGGLHPRISDLHLQKLFSPYGEIVRINIVTHNPSSTHSTNSHSKSAGATKYKAGLQQSKGYAFVEYKSIESARMAMSRVDGRQLLGRSLAVRPSRRKHSDVGGLGSAATGKADTKVSAEEAKREFNSVQSKIEAVKRAIEQKKKGL